MRAAFFECSSQNGSLVEMARMGCASWEKISRACFHSTLTHPRGFHFNLSSYATETHRNFVIKSRCNLINILSVLSSRMENSGEFLAQESGSRLAVSIACRRYQQFVFISVDIDSIMFQLRRTLFRVFEAHQGKGGCRVPPRGLTRLTQGFCKNILNSEAFIPKLLH